MPNQVRLFAKVQLIFGEAIEEKRAYSGIFLSQMVLRLTIGCLSHYQ